MKYSQSGASRRQWVVLMGTAGASLALAGCLDDDNDAVDDGIDDEDSADDDVDMEALEDHLSDANGWEGETQDHTGEDALAIEVGDPEGGNNFMFAPVAPEVDVGTEVTWEWVDDQNHSVTDEGGAFDSGVESDHTFEHTFDEAGTYLYFCQPHRAQGHIGAIVVHDE